jgi:CDP-diacylglycerol--serine O-phosphatidyltransferase
VRRHRVSILASLCTLGNAMCGLGAITLTAKALLLQDSPEPPQYATYQTEIVGACLLVVLAMVFDALDGRLARFARATSDFGGQLDSLADAISFGLAPAFLMNRVVVETLNDSPAFGSSRLLWIAWVCAAVYLGCALIRLARFNVENVHDEEAHLSFKGLPSPAAAGALVSLIIVVVKSCPEQVPGTCSAIMLWALPVVTVILGLLMVSQLRYLHLLNQFVRGRRSINHLVLMVFMIAVVLVLALVIREYILAVGFVGYALSGPIAGLLRGVIGRRPATQPPDLFNQSPKDSGKP